MHLSLTPRQISRLALLALLTASSASAQLYESGSTGVLGPLVPVANVTIDLPEDGVLHYTEIDIPAGVTVKFRRNKENTPAYLLASGDINIAGIVDVSGRDGVTSAGLAGLTQLGGVGGPGGSDGGSAASAAPSAGVGPGPGLAQQDRKGGGGASPITNGNLSNGDLNGSAGGTAYADAGYQFLHGGSGGGASNSVGGGGGGGVIVIAASGKITIDGSVLAKGGGSWSYSGSGGGGVIRLAAEEISGTGVLNATGNDTIAGQNACDSYYGGSCGGGGVIRIEAFEVSGSFLTKSTPGAFMALPIASVPFPSSSRPKLAVTKVAGKKPVIGSYFGHAHQSPGLSLPINTALTVEVTANNVPLGQKVNVIVNTVGKGRQVYQTGGLVGAVAESTASVEITVPTGTQIGTIEAWIPNVPLPN